MYAKKISPLAFWYPTKFSATFAHGEWWLRSFIYDSSAVFRAVLCRYDLSSWLKTVKINNIIMQKLHRTLVLIMFVNRYAAKQAPVWRVQFSDPMSWPRSPDSAFERLHFPLCIRLTSGYMAQTSQIGLPGVAISMAWPCYESLNAGVCRWNRMSLLGSWSQQ